MVYLLIGLLALIAVNVGVSLWLLHLVREVNGGMKAALQHIQVQLAFLSGRIGLSKKDLDRPWVIPPDQTPAPPFQTTEVPPEVLGDSDWVDLDEEERYASPTGPGQEPHAEPA